MSYPVPNGMIQTLTKSMYCIWDASRADKTQPTVPSPPQANRKKLNTPADSIRLTHRWFWSLVRGGSLSDLSGVRGLGLDRTRWLRQFECALVLALVNLEDEPYIEGDWRKELSRLRAYTLVLTKAMIFFRSVFLGHFQRTFPHCRRVLNIAWL